MLGMIASNITDGDCAACLMVDTLDEIPQERPDGSQNSRYSNGCFLGPVWTSCSQSQFRSFAERYESDACNTDDEDVDVACVWGNPEGFDTTECASDTF